MQRLVDVARARYEALCLVFSIFMWERAPKARPAPERLIPTINFNFQIKTQNQQQKIEEHPESTMIKSTITLLSLVFLSLLLLLSTTVQAALAVTTISYCLP